MSATLSNIRDAQALLAKLTPRETEILQYVALGLNNKAIAARIDRQERTVAHHIEVIYRKICWASSRDVDRRVEAVLIYQRAQQAGVPNPPFVSDIPLMVSRFVHALREISMALQADAETIARLLPQDSTAKLLHDTGDACRVAVGREAQS